MEFLRTTSAAGRHPFAERHVARWHRRGIAVPVSVFPEAYSTMNSDTGTTDTGDIGSAELPPEASELDRVPMELEEANAMEAGVTVA